MVRSSPLNHNNFFYVLQNMALAPSNNSRSKIKDLIMAACLICHDKVVIEANVFFFFLRSIDLQVSVQARQKLGGQQQENLSVQKVSQSHSNHSSTP